MHGGGRVNGVVGGGFYLRKEMLERLQTRAKTRALGH